MEFVKIMVNVGTFDVPLVIDLSAVVHMYFFFCSIPLPFSIGIVHYVFDTLHLRDGNSNSLLIENCDNVCLIPLPMEMHHLS